MKLVIRILAPLLIVGLALLVARQFILTKPEPRTFSVPDQVTAVEATRLKPQTYEVILDTQGTVAPRTTSTLIPEVSGRVTAVSPAFRNGGFFSEGDILLELDTVNYETALIVAESTVAQVELALSEEKVRASQAIENWRRLGKSGEPNDLAARVPQMAEVRARLRAAEAEVEQAKRNLERTRVRAPFDGRIIEQNVDVGQFVNSNTQLGRAFATDVMEVRLPLTNRQLSFVDLPEPFEDDSPDEAREGPSVLLRGGIGRDTGEWQGQIVRVDSSIDEMSRQLFVVAEVEDPYRRKTNRNSLPLKIGLFVEGYVKGEELENVFVLPRKAVRVGGDVIVINTENRIRRQQVEPIWSEEEYVVIPAEGAGLAEGDIVCLTPLAYPANGALVLPTIDGVSPEIEIPGRKPDRSAMKGKGKGKGKGKS